MRVAGLVVALGGLVATATAAPPSAGVASAPGPAPAPAPPAAPASIEVAYSDGVVVDWTTLTMRITASAVGYGLGPRSAVEMQARQEIGPVLLASVPKLPVTAAATFGDLTADDAVGAALKLRTSRWEVAEARYYTSGRVELVGELSLHELLKPWTLAQAKPTPLPPPIGTPDDAPTGLVVDARGVGATPGFAPRLVGEDGAVIWDGALWEDAAVEHAPAVWVPDPAHPAAARAGDRPLVLRATGARGCDLVVGAADAARFRDELAEARSLGHGTFVVVVDG